VPNFVDSSDPILYGFCRIRREDFAVIDPTSISDPALSAVVAGFLIKRKWQGWEWRGTRGIPFADVVRFLVVVIACILIGALGVLELVGHHFGIPLRQNWIGGIMIVVAVVWFYAVFRE
jgi:hypothetical protein